MKTKIKLGIALVVFLGLILLTEFNRSTSKPDSGEPETTFKEYDFADPEFTATIDTSQLLQLFFSEGKIAGTNLIGWKPDLEARLSMSISEDGNCYTSLDTIIHVDIYHDLDLYIFRTVSYLKDMKTMNLTYPPDYSFALVEGNSGNIKTIKQFSRKALNVDFTARKKVTELIPVGPERRALKIVSDVASGDLISEQTTLIDLQNLQPLLQFESLSSNERVIDDPYQINNGLIKKEVELTTETGKTGLYDIILTQRETAFDSIQERIITRYSTKVYRWNNNDELELAYE